MNRQKQTNQKPWPPVGVDWYYSDDYVCIAHGDCREIVPTLGRFDLLLTDPPYGIGADEAASKNKGKWGWKYHGETAWDRNAPTQETFDMLLAVADVSVIWGGNYFAHMLPPSMGWLAWDKGQKGFSCADFEMAWTSLWVAARRCMYPRAKALGDGKVHPTQKPLDVMRWCVEWADARSQKAQTILDPFAGSGTTGRAAKDLQRKCVLIEREERYCEIAARRMRQEVLPLEMPNASLEARAGTTTNGGSGNDR